MAHDTTVPMGRLDPDKQALFRQFLIETNRYKPLPPEEPETSKPGLPCLIPSHIDPDGIPVYLFDTPYISGDAYIAISEFTDKNQLIEKLDCGLGGSTSQLNQNVRCVIMISPNVSQIQGKEAYQHEYAADNLFFFYSGSKSKWSEVNDCIDRGDQFVVMTTPDNLLHIVKANNPVLYDKLKDINLFIDESHTIILDSGYRAVMKELYEDINTQWRATYKLSTGTVCPHYIDIPDDVEKIKIGRKNPKSIHGFYSTDYEAYKHFVEEQFRLGRLVLIFSNDWRVYNYIGSKYGHLAHYGTSDALEIKVKKWFSNLDNKLKIKEVIEADEHRIIVFSSTFFCGYDILPKRDCSVVFINDPTQETTNFNLLDFKQAINRPRVLICDLLLVNKPLTGKISKGDYSVNYNPPTTQLDLDRALKHYFNKNDFDSRYEKIKLYNEFNMFNDDARTNVLSSYHILLEPYVFRTLPKDRLMTKAQEFRNILNYDTNALKADIDFIRYRFYGKDSGSFNVGHALFYYSAYIIKKFNNPVLLAMLNDSRFDPRHLHNVILQSLLIARTPEFFINTEVIAVPSMGVELLIPACKLFGFEIDEIRPTNKEISDYLLLYWAKYLRKETKKGRNGKPPTHYDNTYDFYTLEQIRTLIIEAIFHEKEFFWPSYPNNNIKRNMESWMRHKLMLCNIVLTPDELESMDETINDTIKEFKKKHIEYINSKTKNPNVDRPSISNDKTVEKMIKAIKNSCLVIFSRSSGTLIIEKRDREYSSFINLPSSLRSFIPIKLDAIDMVGAFPNFVRQYFGEHFKLIIPYIPVYENVAKYYNCSIKKAKILYNMHLNYETNEKTKTLHFFKKAAGYPHKFAVALTDWIIDNVKGHVYNVFVKMEKEAIENYIDVLVMKFHIKITNWMRYHDAVCVPSFLVLTIDETTHQLSPKFPIPTEHMGNQFLHKSFNYFDRNGRKFTYDLPGKN